MSSFYALLGCEENASYEEIKKCYQDLVRKSHPDKTLSLDGDRNEYFIKINAAWQTLRDPAKRKAYDAQLLAEQCESENVLYATVTQDDMSLERDVYSYPCRCGSLYSIPKNDFANDGMDLYYQCSECSLGILIRTA